MSTLNRFLAPFQGLDGEECEAFIVAVKKHVFERGKDQDDAWVARYASTLMEGLALRWFEELDDDVQASWKLLKQALLEDFPRKEATSHVPRPQQGQSLPSRKRVRSPSPVGAISAPPAIRPRVTLATGQIGYLKYVTHQGGKIFYVQSDATQDGRLKMGPYASALKVQLYGGEDDIYRMKLLNFSKARCIWLALHWRARSNDGDRCGAFQARAPGNNSPFSEADLIAKGHDPFVSYSGAKWTSCRKNIWRFTEGGSLVPFRLRKDSEERETLSVTSHGRSGIIVLSAGASKGFGFTSGDIVFEVAETRPEITL